MLFRSAEAEKQASYTLGVQETQSRLTEEFSSVARDYCDITWEKTLDAAGVPADSSLRRPESIYYDPDIQALPGSDSPPPEQLASASEAPATSQTLLASMEVPTDSHQDASRGKRVEAPQDKTSDAAPSHSEQVADHQAPKTKT